MIMKGFFIIFSDFNEVKEKILRGFLFKRFNHCLQNFDFRGSVKCEILREIPWKPHLFEGVLSPLGVLRVQSSAFAQIWRACMRFLRRPQGDLNSRPLETSEALRKIIPEAFEVGHLSTRVLFFAPPFWPEMGILLESGHGLKIFFSLS